MVHNRDVAGHVVMTERRHILTLATYHSD
jgi:hypothetical protein